MSWHRIDLLALDSEPTEPPAWAGLVYRGRRHLFSGEPETAKTIAAIAIGLEIIRAGGDVLYLDYEMGARDALARLREMGYTDDDLAHVMYVEPETAPKPNEIVGLLTPTTRLAILDAASGSYEIANLDDTRTKDAERWARLHVKPLHKAGVASLVIDHVVKNREARGKYASGNHRKVGGVDVHLSFEMTRPFHRGHDGHANIFTRKDRPGHLARPKAAELELRSLDAGAIGWTFLSPTASTTDAGGFRPTVLMGRVSDYLAMQSDPVSRKSVEDAVKGTREYVRVAIDVLVAEGYATEKKGARGARLLTLERSFLDDLATSPDIAATSPTATSFDLATSPTSLQGTARCSEVTTTNGDHDLAGRFPDLEQTFAALEAEIITAGEWRQAELAHRLLLARRSTLEDVVA